MINFLFKFFQAELYTHVVEKFEQLGSIMGGVVGMGYSLIRKKPVAASMLNGARNGWLIGIPVGALALSRMMANMAKVSIIHQRWNF